MPRSFGVQGAWLIATTLLALSGCRTYEPAPLDPQDILATVETRRHVAAATERVALVRAVDLARERSPSLLPAREAAATARALAEMPTPLPNPTFGVGPTLLSGPGVEDGSRWGVEAAGGWLLDVSGNRAAATAIRAAEANAARVELVVRERETYLALRRAFTRLGAARRHRSMLEEIAGATASSERVARRLVEAARATALDVVELQVEALRATSDVQEALEDEQSARDEIARLTGVAAEHFADVEMPAVPASAPARYALVAQLIAGHPALDALRAEHDVAEANLRAEIAGQIPGIELGPGSEREEKVNKYSLGIGFELPIFDRNELGIEAADGRRRQVAAQFDAEVTRRLTDIDAGLARLERRLARLAVLRERAEPAARHGLELAESALRGGALDGLRYLTVARTERSVRLDRLDAEQAVIEAWCDLEDACGSPLLVFPSTTLLPTDTGNDGTNMSAGGE